MLGLRGARMSRDLFHWPVVNGPARELRATLREGRRDWFRIDNSASGTASIYIYDEIGYWGVTAGDFVATLTKLDVRAIDLHISSPGGEVFDGIAIYEALVQHDATVTTYVDSLAASAASFIAMAGDRIVMAKHAEMMIHDALSLCIGNAEEMRKTAELLDRVSDKIAGIYAERGESAEHWRALMREESWFSAQEAVDAGLADEVADPRGAKDVPTNKWDLSIFQYAGREKAPAPKLRSAPHSAEKVDGFSMFDAETFRSAVRKGMQ